jgi:hypothetical protein
MWTEIVYPDGSASLVDPFGYPVSSTPAEAAQVGGASLGTQFERLISGGISAAVAGLTSAMSGAGGAQGGGIPVKHTVNVGDVSGIIKIALVVVLGVVVWKKFLA